MDMSHPYRDYIGLPELDAVVGLVKSLPDVEFTAHTLGYQLKVLAILDRFDMTVYRMVTSQVDAESAMLGYPFENTAVVGVVEYLREELPYDTGNLIRDWVRLYHAGVYDIVVDFRWAKHIQGLL
jgi:hypothetical protein